MKIKQVSCTQFAGIHDKTVSFDDGLNILVGNNETGKSTIVELIYQLLYHDIDAKKSEKSEKDFRAWYYPKGIDTQGDYADGQLVFTMNGDKYHLEKCWGAGAYARLTMPNSIKLQDQGNINQHIRDFLRYKKGLYDDVIFSSQRQQKTIVSHIFQSLSESKKISPKEKNQADAKSDLVSILAQERIQSAGFDLNSFEAGLNQIIAEFEGCWDIDKDVPKTSSLRTKRAGGTPQNEGRLFSTYYIVECLTQLLDNAEKAERAVERDLKELRAQEEKRKDAIKKREDFEQYASLLSEYAANRELIIQLKEDIKRRRQAAKDYPGLKRALSKAVKVRQQLRDEEAWLLYDDILQKRNQWLNYAELLEGRMPVSKDDIANAVSLEKEILRYKRESYGIDLLAELHNTGFNDIQVVSAIDGRPLYSIPSYKNRDKFEIAEPVEIIIPGVMKLRLSDGKSFVRDKSAHLLNLERKLDSVFHKYSYSISTVEQLRELQQRYSADKSELNRLETRYKDALGDRNWDVLEQTYNNLSKRKKRRPISEIKEDIYLLCGEKSIEAYCGELESSIKSIDDMYKEELGEITPEALRLSCDIVEQKLQIARDAVIRVDDIPSQYRKKDVAAFRAELKAAIIPIEAKISEIQNRLKEDERLLGNRTAEEYALELERAKAEHSRTLDDYRHWLHIKSVYQSAKKDMAESSEIRDVERRFADYLNQITSGRVVLKSLNEMMDVSIISGANRLDEEILSEGTKDTIALAFRLAMMEHLFPNGDGLLVLDDPFTEMDADRTMQSCTLLQHFAESGNQVIFVTCDKKYIDLMTGNVIEV